MPSLESRVNELGPWFHNLRLGEDAAVQTAEENADRWRQAAMRKAELAAPDVEGTALAPLVERIRTIDQPGVGARSGPRWSLPPAG